MPASKVTLYAIFGPPEGYTVTVNRNFYCTITASHKTADPGEAVTISVIPESGRKVKEFQINLQKDEYTWVDENTLTFLMPAHDVEFSVKSLQSAITNPFTDVGESDWFYNPVLWAVENKVTGGMTETTFGPNVSCTRAQVVTFLYAAAGKPEVKADSEPFDDVSASDWFYTPVLWAVENGITGGTSETTFGPNEECTRAQVVTFLYAAAGKPEITAGSDFVDVADTDWYAKPVIWAKANDITGGISPTEFGPNNICTRAQVVTFLNKASLVK